MGFFDDFLDGMKDVGTSSVRIVTDTAIDIGDVATGFQFSDEMNKAKSSMTDAGVLSAADAIEKNHYPFLKDMARDAENKVAEIHGHFANGQAQEKRQLRLAQTLADMCADVAQLSELSLEASELLEEAKAVPHWDKWAKALEITPPLLNTVTEVSASMRKWEIVGERMVQTQLVVGTTSGLGALIAIAAKSKGNKLAKLSKTGRVARKAGLSAVGKGSKVAVKATKFLKVGKLAGRASGVLSVVTVGLDVGMSVIELEQRKSALEQQLRELDKELAKARAQLAEIDGDVAELADRIDELLRSVKPKQTQGSWDAWVAATEASLRDAMRALVSVAGIEKMAREKAIFTRGRPMAERILFVAAVDPEISEEEAAEIIRAIDLEDGIPLPDAGKRGEVAEISLWSWRGKGPERCLVDKTEGLDGVLLQYGFHALSKLESWTYSATAPSARPVTLRWRYGAAHTPATLATKLMLFVDTAKDGRIYHTLYAGVPQTIAAPGSGEITVIVEKGQSFGLIVAPLTDADHPGYEFCGTYVRHPPENDWHTGTIDFKDASQTMLQWTNRAGVKWDLRPDFAKDRLMKLPGSVYYNQYPGGNSFDIQRTHGEITGFDFLRELYAREADPLGANEPLGDGGLNMGMIWVEFGAA